MDTSQIRDIYNYHAVDDMLSTSGQPTEAQLVSVAREGYGLVVNLALHNDPRYSLRDEPGVVRSLGMEYIHIPVDFDAPRETALLAFFDAMEKHQGRKIFVHCAANMRVSAFLGLYRAIKQSEPTEHAFTLMRAIWEPNPVWVSFISSMLQKYGD
jgi:protein tyrosine phosphatase (PTP) superfamily phosphohydrolase (DUF442 family)